MRVLLADHILQVQRLLFALRRHDDRLFGVLVKALRLVNGRAAVQHIGDVAVNFLRLVGDDGEIFVGDCNGVLLEFIQGK